MDGFITSSYPLPNVKPCCAIHVASLVWPCHVASAIDQRRKRRRTVGVERTHDAGHAIGRDCCRRDLHGRVAAAVIALGTSLQHRAASSLQGRGPKAPGLLKHLLLRPGWRLGVILSGVGFCLHAAALRQGSISLVQPIVVSAIVFAVFVRAALDRQRPTREEVSWAAWTWAGVALLISLLPAAITAGITAQRADDRMARIFFTGGIVITDIAILGAHQTSSRRCRGLLLGGASGVLFGLVAGLVKVLTSVAGGDVLTMARHWWFVGDPRSRYRGDAVESACLRDGVSISHHACAQRRQHPHRHRLWPLCLS